MNKTVKVIFSPEAQEMYDKFTNAVMGSKPNRLVTNLFRIELPLFWRMLYTLVNGDNEMEIVAFILDIIDHDIYNKKFGYRNR